MKRMNWEFAVIKSPMVNAFVAPGGKVVVFTGKAVVAVWWWGQGVLAALLV